MMESEKTLVKAFIFFSNLFIMIMGVALILGGVMVETMYKEYFIFLNEEVMIVGISYIVVGTSIFVVSIIGLYGVLKEDCKLLVVHTVLQVIFFLFQIAYIVLVVVLATEMEQILKRNMRNSIVNYNTSSPVKFSWDYLQHMLSCCGVNSYEDWGNYTVKVPDTCCIRWYEGCGKYKDVGDINSFGCLSVAKSMANENMVLLMVFGSIFAVLQIFGIVFSARLAISMQKGYEEME